MMFVLITLISTLLIFSFPQSGDAQTKISRVLSDVSLGMEISDFRDRYESQEMTSSNSLSRGDRVFLVGGRGRDVDFVRCSFYNGKLYKVELFYSVEFSKSVPWGALVRQGVIEYGQGRIVESVHGPMATWGDELSSLKMETRTGKKGQKRFVVSLIDNALYLMRGETCPSERHKT